MASAIITFSKSLPNSSRSAPSDDISGFIFCLLAAGGFGILRCVGGAIVGGGVGLGLLAICGVGGTLGGFGGGTTV